MAKKTSAKSSDRRPQLESESDAESFFNALAPGKHAESAGTESNERIAPLVVDAMKEIDIDILSLATPPFCHSRVRISAGRKHRWVS